MFAPLLDSLPSNAKKISTFQLYFQDNNSEPEDIVGCVISLQGRPGASPRRPARLLGKAPCDFVHRSAGYGSVASRRDHYQLFRYRFSLALCTCTPCKDIGIDILILILAEVPYRYSK